MSDNLIRRELQKRKRFTKRCDKTNYVRNICSKSTKCIFVNRMREINNQLNEAEDRDVENPYFIASPFIGDIISDNRNIDLLDDELTFRDIDVPSPPGIVDSITQSFNTQTVQGGAPNASIVGNMTQAWGLQNHTIK